jgi:hypothetical protein
LWKLASSLLRRPHRSRTETASGLFSQGCGSGILGGTAGELQMTLPVGSRDLVSERAAIDAKFGGRTLVGAFAETVEGPGARRAREW